MVSKVINAVKDKTERSIAGDTCHHHWVIETAQGPTSDGVCKNCGTRKEFLNAIPEDSPPQTRDKGVLKLPELPDIDFDRKKRRS